MDVRTKNKPQTMNHKWRRGW